MRTATVVLAVAVLATAGTASALGYSQPAHVSCSYDEAALRTYQPETGVGHLDVKPTASYGGVYSSPERGTDVYVYFLRYARQTGVTVADSHRHDREPVYVLVDDATGEVKRVVYSAYHYVKAAGTPSSLPMNGSHARLRVVEPWHQYVPSGASGTLVELRNFCAAVDRWHANGWDASKEATKNPWTMTRRESWWAEGTAGHSLAQRYAEAKRELGEAIPDVNVSLPEVGGEPAVR